MPRSASCSWTKRDRRSWRRSGTSSSSSPTTPLARTWSSFSIRAARFWGTAASPGSFRPSDKEITAESIILDFKKTYLAKAAADDENNPVAFEAITDHFERVNATIRGVERRRLEAEPRQLDALLTFAARAYRRPLSQAERDDLLAFYRSLREKSSLTHEEAMRDLIVNVLMSPHFSYRIDLGNVARNAVPSTPLSDFALASRLSYFLWSSMPDAELSARAAAGDLRNDSVLIAQVRRMLKRRSRAPAGNGVRGQLARFPALRGTQRGRSRALPGLQQRAAGSDVPGADTVHQRCDPQRPFGARHAVRQLHVRQSRSGQTLWDARRSTVQPDEWVRVDNARDYQRGGLLPMAAFLTQNSPGLRTSPVKRGYWVARRVLGEVIPPPPPTVPELPKDEAKLDLPLRDVLAKHRDNPACSVVSCALRYVWVDV